MQEKDFQIFIERIAHDVVSPLSSACMLAEMLDELDNTLHTKLLQIINIMNFIKYTCQDNNSHKELSMHFKLFHKITSNPFTAEDCNHIKHLLLWLFFKQSKETSVSITSHEALIIAITHISISDEEIDILNKKQTHITHHTIYLMRFINVCKQFQYAYSDEQLVISINRNNS